MPAERNGIKQIAMTPSERSAYGVTCTFEDGHARHFPGAIPDAMLALAAFADRYDLRVACLSTPATIYRDLQGTRAPLTPGSRSQTPPEARLLGSIGRLDLLAS